jgi:hypothetical protein
MSERGLPPNDRDPVDDAYRQAEALLSDDDARAARRAKVLAAVAREAPAPSREPRRGVAGRRQWAGWLVAASVAALGVFITSEIYRPPPPAPVQTSSSPAGGSAPSRGQPVAPAAPGRAAARRAAAGAAPAQAPATPPAAAQAASATVRKPPSVSELRVTALKREQQLQNVPVAITAFTGSQRDAKPNNSGPTEPERRASPLSPPPPAPPPPPPPPPPPAPAERVAGAVAPPADKAQASGVTETVVTAHKRDTGAELREAAAAGRTAEVKALLAKGAPVDATDEDGESALMKAVEADQPATAALLVRHGASLELRNSDGRSARDMAAGKDDPVLRRALGLNR